MKKFILILFIVAGLNAGGFSPSLTEIARLMVKRAGFQCNKVDNLVRSAFNDSELTIYCDSFSYVYTIKDVGGYVQVKVK